MSLTATASGKRDILGERMPLNKKKRSSMFSIRNHEPSDLVKKENGLNSLHPGWIPRGSYSDIRDKEKHGREGSSLNFQGE